MMWSFVACSQYCTTGQVSSRTAELGDGGHDGAHDGAVCRGMKAFTSLAVIDWNMN